MKVVRIGLAALLAAGSFEAGALAGSLRGYPGRAPHAMILPQNVGDNSGDVGQWPALPPAPPVVSGSSTAGYASPADCGPPVAPVPEPSGVAMAVTGLAALAVAARRRRVSPA